MLPRSDTGTTFALSAPRPAKSAVHSPSRHPLCAYLTPINAQSPRHLTASLFRSVSPTRNGHPRWLAPAQPHAPAARVQSPYWSSGSRPHPQPVRHRQCGPWPSQITTHHRCTAVPCCQPTASDPHHRLGQRRGQPRVRGRPLLKRLGGLPRPHG